MFFGDHDKLQGIASCINVRKSPINVGFKVVSFVVTAKNLFLFLDFLVVKALNEIYSKN